jgi:hypothetical protein
MIRLALRAGTLQPHPPMHQWGDKHAAPDGPPLRLIHEKRSRIWFARPSMSRP